MEHTKTKISVGMPVYNGEQYVEKAIRSILDQTYEDFELIISDNASTDRTGEICQDLAALDKRIAYTRNPQNIGAAGNYNRLFALASGDYFRWANADDISGAELHAKCLAVLQEHPDAVLAYGKTRIIDGDGELIRNYDDNLDLQQRRASDRFVQFWKSVGLTNVIYGLMRASAVSKTALMRSGRFPGADTNFMAELILYGKFVEIPEYLFSRRMHPDASSWDRSDSQQQVQFWNAGSAQFTVPSWRKQVDTLRAIAAATLDRQEQLRLFAHTLRRMYWGRRELVRELLQFAAMGLRRGRVANGK